MRNAELRGELPGDRPHPAIPHSEFRTPHSCHERLSFRDDGIVTHAVTHTPQPTHPSGFSTGCPAASSASARSPTGQARAHTPQEAPWNVMQRSGSSSRVPIDRKSTRLNSSHGYISYAVFCLKKKKKKKVTY